MFRAEDSVFIVSGSKLLEPYFVFNQCCSKLCPKTSTLGDEGIESLAFFAEGTLVLLRLSVIDCLYLYNPPPYRVEICHERIRNSDQLH